MSWKSWEDAADRGPGALLWKVFVLFLVCGAVLGFTGYTLGWFGEAATVAQNEFGPKAALAKYEWFVNQSNNIEKADQDIKLFESRVQGVQAQYAGYGTDMSKWPPDVRMQFNHESQQAREDLLAIVSNRNGLVREYNAASEKFNWSPFQTRPDKPKEKFFEYVAP